VAQRPFVERSPQPSQAADTCQQQRVTDRPDQDVVGSCLEPSQPTAGFARRGDDHDRDVQRRRISLEAAAAFEAVQSRDEDIEQDDVGVPRRGEAHRFGAVSHDDDIKYSATSLARRG